MSQQTSPACWQGSLPTGVLLPPAKRNRGSSSPPRQTAWVPPQELINMVDSLGVKPFNFDLAPKSRMKHGIRIDFRSFPTCYLELVRNCRGFFANCTSIFPCPLKGYVDVGFSNEARANHAMTIPVVISDHRLPLLRTRYNKGKAVVFNITRLPTTIEPATLKTSLEAGLLKYGSCQFFYNVHPLLPDFIGFQAYAEVLLKDGLTKADIPQHVFLPEAPDETFFLHADGTRLNINANPIPLGNTRNKKPKATNQTSPPPPAAVQSDLAETQPADDQSSETSQMDDVIAPQPNQSATQPEPAPQQPKEINGYPIYDAFDESWELAVHNTSYPILPANAPAEIATGIRELRNSIIRNAWNLGTINNKITNHLKQFNPPNKPTISRFTNTRQTLIPKIEAEMNQYWHVLSQTTPDPASSDPCIQEYLGKVL